MKHISLLLLFLGLNQVGLLAQNGAKLEALKTAKVAYITKALDLSPAEAEKFWPIYNQYDKERMDMRKRILKEQVNNRMETTPMSDRDAEDMINRHFQFMQSELELEKRYLKEFRNVISVRKIALLYRAEKDFRNELIKKLRANSPPGAN